jgi:hypothetical protein
MTITEASKLIARGKLSSTEMVESCLERIDANEDKIKAWALLDREGALRQAAALDAETRAGRRRGPLHGIPFGIKDIFYTAGMRTEAGSKSWAGFVPSFDSTAVARLRDRVARRERDAPVDAHAEPVQREADEHGDIAVAAHITGAEECATTSGADFLRHARARRGVDVVDDDRGSLLREALRDAFTKS